MTTSRVTNSDSPEILAPAGNRESFIAAIAAQADAIYCGLKSFSARAKADNFTLEELYALSCLAKSRGIKVYVALNTLLKPGEISLATYLIDQIQKHSLANAIIFSDLAVVDIARTTGYKGGLHLSTLGNLGFQKGLDVAGKLGIERVVIPRELSFDEVRVMAQAAPADIQLEAFIHGALCYGVSGRCYWSSWLGGKSGLRGQCVQPCRRTYTQDNQRDRYFSCQDFSIDQLVSKLKRIPAVTTWKIEGRKKGPHYVYNTVSAYRLLRDHGEDSNSVQKALELLDQALGRSTTRFGFGDAEAPINPGVHTGSGKVIGSSATRNKAIFLKPEIVLFPGDLLRVGYEDGLGHFTQKIRETINSGDEIQLKGSGGEPPEDGTPVFLIDRRQTESMGLIKELEKELKTIEVPEISKFQRKTSKIKKPHSDRKPSAVITDCVVERKLPKNREQFSAGMVGLWLSEKAVKSVPPKYLKEYQWWLPPNIWSNDQRRVIDLVRLLLKRNVMNFVFNAPWQLGIIPDKHEKGALRIWAGPFCNISNRQSVRVLKRMGFDGVIVSPELSRVDYLDLARQSDLPLGIVLEANWPLCVARTVSDSLELGAPFASPRGETSWVTKYGQDYWIYPNWRLDLTGNRKALEQAGYEVFIKITEPVPRGISLKKRPGLWNWDLKLE